MRCFSPVCPAITVFLNHSENAPPVKSGALYQNTGSYYDFIPALPPPMGTASLYLYFTTESEKIHTNLVSTYKFSPYDKNTSKILCKMSLFPAPISGRGLCVFSSGVWAIIPSGALFHDTKIVPKKKNASKYVLGCVLLFLGDFFTAPLCLCR